MKKNTQAIIIATVTITAIAGFVVVNAPDKTTPDSTMSSGNTENIPSDTKTSNGVEDLTNQTEVTMDIKDFAFAKKNIKIKVGTKVTWTNRDSAKHNAYSDDANGPKGQLLAKGESYSFVFENVGTTNYYCEPHPYMKGIINVVQ